VTGRPKLAFSEKEAPFRKNVNIHFPRLQSLEKSKLTGKPEVTKSMDRKPKITIKCYYIHGCLCSLHENSKSAEEKTQFMIFLL
jgi:hypothetical protein